MKCFKMIAAMFLVAMMFVMGCWGGEGCKVDGDCRAKNYLGQTMIGTCSHPGDPMIGGTCHYTGEVDKTTPAVADSGPDASDTISNDGFTPTPEVEDHPPDTNEVTEEVGGPDTTDNGSTETGGETTEVEPDTKEDVKPPECVCDDTDACTTDTCVDGECVYTHNNNPCDDGDTCTTNDFCQAGVCEGSPTKCNDNNPCTDDSCEASSGCVYANNENTCEDGNPCTESDLCEAGQCESGANTCACLDTTDCVEFEDVNLCNGTLVCFGNECVVDQDSVVTCDSSQDWACEKAACNPKSGTCNLVNNEGGTNCDDGSACTFGDACVEGKCLGKSVGCDDGNVCTDDSCDPATGCAHANNNAPCTDDNACTMNDACLAGKCQKTSLINCDDGKLCNGAEVCNPATGCESGSPLPNCCQSDVDCADESVCTTEKCVTATGTCESTTVNCDDFDACTTDSCDPIKGCAHEDIVCMDDGNVCTIDSCHPVAGCLYVAYPDGQQPCTDESSCTVDDLCMSGACVGQKEVECNDQNPCTDDSCDPQTGCVYVPNTTPCSDDNACTVSDQCAANACESGTVANCDDKNPCTNDACDPATGCNHVPGPDTDGDGVCDALDSDNDNDGVFDNADNCPSASNPDQKDTDEDDLGDVCDSTLDCVGYGTDTKNFPPGFWNKLGCAGACLGQKSQKFMCLYRVNLFDDTCTYNPDGDGVSIIQGDCDYTTGATFQCWEGWPAPINCQEHGWSVHPPPQ